MITPHAGHLQQITIRSLSQLGSHMPQFSAAFGKGQNYQERQAYVSGILGAALAVTLNNQGWNLRALPGEPVELTLGDQTIAPFTVVDQLRHKELLPEIWERQCSECKIANLPLTVDTLGATKANCILN